ncbi:hypothetical protein DFP72DRAFT_1095714 [Ephemerocybe angulata]|uniref:DUF6533 domain-containing protein n=1 Tax=Ephemerocybe angulata TaxID=980116 RepID=A0A8H6HCU7_9AGAR|nr:hypothetical protein DFP72DRAFT_1095714 [Tulosesus angulatus]
MSLSPEKVAELTEGVSGWFTQDYTMLGFNTFFLYHYLTTLAEEDSTIWPQKWRTGKILFLLLRYTPICYIILEIFLELRIHMDLTPQVCQGVYISNVLGIGRVILLGAEVVILLCLHALLGARRRYLALLIFIYAVESSLVMKKALRLFTAVTGSFGELLGFYSIPDTLAIDAQHTVMPILACRLLLNMRKTEDPSVQKTVSSLLFGAPGPGDDSEDNDDEPTGISLGPVQRYAGLGRQGDAKGGMARRDAEAEVGTVPVAENNEGL